MTDWVNFALGEDIRTEARRLQDEIWAEAETDGRRHVSARELTILHRNEALYGIQTYYCIVELLDALRNRLNPFLLSIIIDYAYPAQGLSSNYTISSPLVFIEHTLRYATLIKKTSISKLRIPNVYR